MGEDAAQVMLSGSYCPHVCSENPNYRYPFCVANLPDVTVVLQQHPLSKSHRQKQTAVSDSLVVRSQLARHLLRTMSEDHNCKSKTLLLISHPRFVTSSEELLDACQYLSTLFDMYVSQLAQFGSSVELKQILVEQKNELAMNMVAAACAVLGERDNSLKHQCCLILGVDMMLMRKYDLIYLISSGQQSST